MCSNIALVVAMLVMVSTAFAAPVPAAAMVSAGSGASSSSSSSSGGLSPKAVAGFISVIVVVGIFVVWAFGTLRYGRWTLCPWVWGERNPQDVEDYEEEFDRAKAYKPARLCPRFLLRIFRPAAYKAEQEATRRKLEAYAKRELDSFLAKADLPASAPVRSAPAAPAPARLSRKAEVRRPMVPAPVFVASVACSPAPGVTPPIPSAQLVERIEAWAVCVREVKPVYDLGLPTVDEERDPEDAEVEAAEERAHLWAIKDSPAGALSGYPWLRVEE